MKIVNNRSLEDALAVVFGESPSFSTGSIASANGANVEQATQVSFESVGQIFSHSINILSYSSPIKQFFKARFMIFYADFFDHFSGISCFFLSPYFMNKYLILLSQTIY